MVTVDQHFNLQHTLFQLSSRAGMSLSPLNDDNGKPYFVYFVKKHLGSLDVTQWVNYRAQAENISRNSDSLFDFSANYTLDDLLYKLGLRKFMCI